VAVAQAEEDNITVVRLLIWQVGFHLPRKKDLLALAQGARRSICDKAKRFVIEAWREVTDSASHV
jgi:hypothetical protein